MDPARQNRDMLMSHMNTLDEILSGEGETPEMHFHAGSLLRTINVLNLSPLEKRALKAQLWREELEAELKTTA